MTENKFYERLKECLKPEQILVEEPMAKHTTFRIGGSADYFVMPSNAGEVQKIVSLCKECFVSFYIIGNGSNLLVSDDGYRGVIIQIGRMMGSVEIESNIVKVQAGCLLSKAASEAYEHGLTGLEFAAGIPGTIGGAVAMNAGAYGGEMKDVILDAVILDQEGQIRTLTNEELELSYRKSVVAREGYVVLEVRLALKPADQAEIKKTMDELKESRILKQPLQEKSAGSTFKRPEGHFAGKLIQDAGLKGFTIGNAQVSMKHSGFVINRGGATAKEVDQLMQEVSRIVEEKFGVKLEPEVKKIGKF